MGTRSTGTPSTLKAEYRQPLKGGDSRPKSSPIILCLERSRWICFSSCR